MLYEVITEGVWEIMESKEFVKVRPHSLDGERLRAMNELKKLNKDT